MLEFGFDLNQGCSGVRNAFPHLFSSTTALVLLEHQRDPTHLITSGCSHVHKPRQSGKHHK